VPDKVTTGSPIGHHRLADREARHAIAQRADHAGYLQPGHVRRLRQAGLVPVQAPTDVDVDQADGGICDIDGHLARPGDGVSQFGQLEDFWPPKRVTTAARMAGSPLRPELMDRCLAEL
jgi:hypothetical protein